MFHPLDHPCGPPLDSLQQAHVSPVLGVQSWTQDSRWGLTRAEYRGRIPSLDLLAMLLLMQPRAQLAFWAARAHCCVILSFLSTSTLTSFSAGLLSIHSLPNLSLCLGLPRPMCRTLHLALLNFLMFAQAHISSQSRSLWMAFHCSTEEKQKYSYWQWKKGLCKYNISLSRQRLNRPVVSLQSESLIFHLCSPVPR